MHMDHHHHHHHHTATGPTCSSVRLFTSHQLLPPQVQLPAINLPQRASATTLPPMAAMDSSPYRHLSPVSWGPSSSSTIHRTSNSRDDISQREMRQMKREPTHQIHSVPPLKEREDTMPATSDLVKKLYKYLFSAFFTIARSIISLQNGNCFVVKDMNEFTKFGEHSLIFGHPDFHADRRDTLENIKRKVPAARKSIPSSSHGGLSAVAEAQAPAAL
ncbi:hypothetical protein F4604DRAFT_1933920 [Suillus subluteus]|nr:hypothetical protein F4604DRAFT_1933920 [Suillus subluteus]